MLEAILDVRKEPGLIQELRGLQVGEALAEGLLGQLGDGLEQGAGHILAHHGGGLEEPFLLRGQAVHPGR